MLSLIPLLIHDADLPKNVRTALHEAQSTRSAAVRTRAHQTAAAGLQAAYGLACDELKDLLDPNSEHLRCAA